MTWVWMRSLRYFKCLHYGDPQVQNTTKKKTWCLNFERKKIHMILIYLVNFNLSDNEQLIEDIWHKKTKKKRCLWLLDNVKVVFSKKIFFGLFFLNLRPQGKLKRINSRSVIMQVCVCFWDNATPLWSVTGADHMSVGQCDVTLSKADQILGALIHPLSVKFLQNNCPWDRTETLSHWKSFVLLRQQGWQRAQLLWHVAHPPPVCMLYLMAIPNVACV